MYKNMMATKIGIWKAKKRVHQEKFGKTQINRKADEQKGIKNIFLYMW